MSVDGLKAMSERANRIERMNPATEPCNDWINWPQIGRVRTRTIEDQKLMLDEQLFVDDGSSAARLKQAGDRYNQVDENYGEITHH